MYSLQLLDNSVCLLPVSGVIIDVKLFHVISLSLPREEQQPRLSNCAAGCQSMPVARWSTGTVRKKSCYRDRTGGTFQSHLHDSCGLAGLVYGGDISAFLHTAPPGWGDSDSGQESPSQATGVKVHGHGPQTPGPHMVQRSTDDCDTEEDVGDTSVFDYSSVTTCSPDGTLRREGEASNTEEEDEEEDTDSQVPVLLKPSYTQQQQSLSDSPRERTVCLRWQIPRLPYPSPRSPRHHAGPAGLEGQGQTPGPAGPYGNRVINITKGPPPLIPTSVFRPIWDEPPKQVFFPSLYNLGCVQSMARCRQAQCTLDRQHVF